MSSTNDPLANNNLTNEEIRRRLTVDFKVVCGPVTPSTRRVLLKKLAKLEGDRSFVPGVVNDNHHDESNLSDNSTNQIDESLVINGKHGDISEHAESLSFSLNDSNSNLNRSPKKNSPRRYSPRRKTADEIEAIKSFNEIKSKPTINNKQPIITQEIFKPKSVQNSIVKTIHLNDLSPKLNEYSSESSESEDDSSAQSTPIASFLSTPRIVSPRIFNGESFKPPLTRPPIRRTIIDNKNSTLQNYSDSESDIDELKNDKLCKMLLSHRPGLSRTTPSHKASYFSKVSSFFSNLKKKFTSNQTDSSNVNFSASSSYISFALLIFVVIFFVVIFSVYFYAKFTLNAKHTLDLNDYAFIEDKSKLIAPICENISITDKCLPFESDRKPTLNVVKEIKGYIDKSIYDYYCELSNPVRDITSFSFKTTEIAKSLQNKVDLFNEERDPSLARVDSLYSLFSRDFDNAIKLIKLNPSWNLETSHFEELIIPTSDYTVQLPLRCNLLIFWRSHFFEIIAGSLGIIIPFLIVLYRRKTKRAESEEQNLVYDLIGKSIELLQSPDEPQSMPVLHIRDTLLSPSERKSTKYRRIWNKVVNHIENSESRVKVEYKKIDGEDFKAWKWIATNANFLTDNEMDLDGSLAPGFQIQKIGGIEWQGQAFSNLLANKNAKPEADSRDNSNSSFIMTESYRNKNFQALTRFLKIRNIFEKEAQFLDSNLTKKIKNTILEKTASSSPTGTHDIVHIELEDNTNEGLVYLKCASIAGATNTFHALHGWWCEKKLVSVKFLKEDRYYMRFPESKNATVPLKIELIN